MTLTGLTNADPHEPQNSYDALRSRWVLVTGATGFIGVHLVRSLIDAGAHVRALVRNPLKAAALPGGVERCFGDLSDGMLPKELADGVDIVFHLAAATCGEWRTHERVTVDGTRRLLALCRAAGIERFVHVSSIAAYETMHLRSGDTICADAPLAAPDTDLGSYARGKAEAERAVRTAGIAFTIVRPGLVYGPGHVIFDHLGRKLAGTFIGVGRRDLVLPLASIQSIADALLRVAVSPNAAGKAYAVVDTHMPRRVYIRTLAQQQGASYRHCAVPLWIAKAVARLCEISKRTTHLQKIPDTSVAKVRSRSLDLNFDTAELRRDTGWSPRAMCDDLRGALASTALERSGPIRVGIVGAGNVARMHVQALRRIHNVQLVGLLDTAPGLAATLAGESGVTCSYDNIDAFYADGRPEVVHVLTPPAAHCATVIAALERGVHVLCEKPLALTVDECQRIHRVAESRGLLVCVNHNYLFDERVATARRMLREGNLGEVRHVDMFWGFDVQRLTYFRSGRAARTHWSYGLPGGLLEDLAPHPLSILLALLGPDARMTHASVRETGRIGPGIHEELRVGLEADSMTANLAISLAARPDDFTVHIFGTQAALRLDLQDMLVQRTRLGKGPKPIARGVKVGRANLHCLLQLACNPFRLLAGLTLPPADPIPLLRAFYDALQGRAAVPVASEEATKVVEVIRTIWPLTSRDAADSNGTRRERPDILAAVKPVNKREQAGATA